MLYVSFFTKEVPTDAAKPEESTKPHSPKDVGKDREQTKTEPSGPALGEASHLIPVIKKELLPIMMSSQPPPPLSAPGTKTTSSETVTQDIEVVPKREGDVCVVGEMAEGEAQEKAEGVPAEKETPTVVSTSPKPDTGREEKGEGEGRGEEVSEDTSISTLTVDEQV